MKEIQSKVKEFVDNHNLECNPESRALDLMSELGEIAKELLKSSDYGKHGPKESDELSSELGDLLFSLICLANSFDIELEEALDKVLDKYSKRLEKGGAGSENE